MFFFLLIIFNISRLFKYNGGCNNLYIAPTLCFMLLDGTAIFRETTECIYVEEVNKQKKIILVMFNSNSNEPENLSCKLRKKDQFYSKFVYFIVKKHLKF